MCLSTLYMAFSMSSIIWSFWNRHTHVAKQFLQSTLFFFSFYWLWNCEINSPSVDSPGCPSKERWRRSQEKTHEENLSLPCFPYRVIRKHWCRRSQLLLSSHLCPLFSFLIPYAPMAPCPCQSSGGQREKFLIVAFMPPSSSVGKIGADSGQLITFVNKGIFPVAEMWRLGNGEDRIWFTVIILSFSVIALAFSINNSIFFPFPLSLFI